MNFRNIEYLVGEAFIGIWRNGIMAVASVSTVALSLAVLGAFMLIAMGSHRFVENQLAAFEIRAFTPVSVSQDDAEKALHSIEKLPLVGEARLLSRDAEWAAFKQKKLNVDIELSGVPSNPLPYTISVKPKDTHKLSELAEQIRGIEGIEDVRNAESDYSYVRAIANIIRVIGTVAVLVLTLTTLFVIGNAIRLTLYARRQEIRIMQLVGATNWFIRVPLILEGIVIGAIGAAMAAGLISAGSEYTGSVVRTQLPATLRSMSSGVTMSQMAVFMMIGGAAIGALGSFLSMRRFLRI